MKTFDRCKVTGGVRVSEEKRTRARQLRRGQTSAEARAWQILRGRRVLGLKFRRQQVIRGFIVDFYCPRLHLAIEIDGAVHDEQRAQDEARSLALTEVGVTVVRLANDDVNESNLRSLIEAYMTSHRRIRPRK